jgi:hypothetical protein
VAML